MSRLGKKMLAFRQAALEYPQQITDWKVFFMAGIWPDMYFLGNF